MVAYCPMDVSLVVALLALAVAALCVARSFAPREDTSNVVKELIALVRAQADAHRDLTDKLHTLVGTQVVRRASGDSTLHPHWRPRPERPRDTWEEQFPQPGPEETDPVLAKLNAELGDRVADPMWEPAPGFKRPNGTREGPG
mgnify:CR=1 FL=1